ncbi:MAG: hydroxymethylbilane synthase [Saprospiraceae bacterium]|nr:hydroxymethylbilane synthase [Saprospiraceae bacterium]
MENTKVRIGSRGSELALWQANYLQSQLLQKCGLEAEIIIIQTKGDKITDLSFDKIEGKGFFTKELEDALLRNEIDVAVHSMKDLPTSSPEGLSLAAVSYREDARDCLLISNAAFSPMETLKIKSNAVIGTSSVRRKSQLSFLKPDCRIADLRGNVPTRIRKLSEGNYDAIVLAKAGLLRLALDLSHITMVDLHPSEFVPAPAQGVLAYQCRTEDLGLRKKLSKIHNAEVAECTNVERKVLQLMEGGCHIPLGVYCIKDELGNFHVHASYAADLSSPLIKVRKSQSTTHMLAESIVEELKTR